MRKDHSPEIDSTTSTTEQASAWWVLLNHGDATPADHHAFGEWVARSPERVEAFLQTARLTSALQSTDLHWPDTPVDTLIREARSAPDGVIDLPMRSVSQESMQVRASPWTRRAIVVGAVALAAGAAGWSFLGQDHYTTSIGEQRSVVLSDGTVVTLNTSSEIEVRMARDHRTVGLLSGEALFQVAPDPARPFDVAAGKATVRALGTQFNVDRRPSSTTVTVVEGKVAVFTGYDPGAASDAQQPPNLPLTAGEQVTVAANTIPHPERVDPAEATVWTRRKLVFEHRPLGEVAEEFNRYNRERIDIESPQLRSQEITGVFEANHPESFMSFLAAIPDVVVERAGDKRVIVKEARKP
ncbi:MAG TPA: FecR domain-containing protein [Steroidobacteraceae bacterium]